MAGEKMALVKKGKGKWCRKSYDKNGKRSVGIQTNANIFLSGSRASSLGYLIVMCQ